MLGDKSYNLGAIVARRLHLNRHNGYFFGGIYASRIANFLGIDAREDENSNLLTKELVRL